MSNKQDIIRNLTMAKMTPNKGLGQNFLIDEAIISRIIAAIEIESPDRVCEIGPGFGALSDQLALKCQSLDLIEIDQRMTEFLSHRFQTHANVKVINADALKASLADYGVLISNMPYSITTPLIEKILTEGNNLRQAVVMMQKDVLPRLISGPGEDGYGPLAILAAHCCEITPITIVKPASFYPVPTVDSIVISIHFKQGIDYVFARKLHEFAKQMFRNRRKTSLNNLLNIAKDKTTAIHALDDAGISPSLRPERLSLEQFCRLMKAVRPS